MRVYCFLADRKSLPGCDDEGDDDARDCQKRGIRKLVPYLAGHRNLVSIGKAEVSAQQVAHIVA